MHIYKCISIYIYIYINLYIYIYVLCSLDLWANIRTGFLLMKPVHHQAQQKLPALPEIERICYEAWMPGEKDMFCML